MALKNVPISTRISQEDAEFLSQLHIHGATTPSDKLRAIIAEAKQRRHKPQDFAGLFKMTLEQLAPGMERLRQAELTEKIHSEALSRVFEWLPDFYSYVTSSLGSPELGKAELADIEAGITARVLRLFESYLQLAVTAQCPCYDPDLLHERLAPLLELAEVIRKHHERAPGR